MSLREKPILNPMSWRCFLVTLLLSVSAAPRPVMAELFSYSETLMAACDQLRTKDYAAVAKEVEEPFRMLYLCEEGGMIWPVRGVATVADDRSAALLNAPFLFEDEAAATKTGKQLETYNIWFSTDTHFGVRIANYTGQPVSKVMVGYKNGSCESKERKGYEKIMSVTMNPVENGIERVLKWRIPTDVTVTFPACLDILKASER